MEQPAFSRTAPPIEGAEALFIRYGDMVYRLAFLRTKSAADADDVVQEVFLRCLRAPRCWNSLEHQRAWFITVTLNCAKSIMSAAFRRHTAALKDELLAEMEERSEVYGEVLKLPDNYRVTIHLYYYEGYKVGEIAKLMNAREGTVKSWLFRARDMLRESLKGECPDV